MNPNIKNIFYCLFGLLVVGLLLYVCFNYYEGSVACLVNYPSYEIVTQQSSTSNAFVLNSTTATSAYNGQRAYCLSYEQSSEVGIYLSFGAVWVLLTFLIVSLLKVFRVVKIWRS